MVLDGGALADAVAAREELERAQDRMEMARADFNRAVTRMHISGASLREIAEALGLSHQRVHQIVDERRTTPAEEVTTTRGRLVHCSFCNKSQKQVKKLIAGPGVYVCEECLGEIHLAVLSRPHDKRVTLVQTAGSNCSFCGKTRNKVAWMSESVREPHERICNECVSLCDNIIHEETGSLT